jgi:hypothetical protein
MVLVTTVDILLAIHGEASNQEERLSLIHRQWRI